MAFGLADDILNGINGVFSRSPSVSRVILFGSRAMNTYRPGSDIDLAVDGELLTFDELLDLQGQLDDLGFLYTFDVKSLKRIKNPDLLLHIERVGKTLYEQQSA